MRGRSYLLSAPLPVFWIGWRTDTFQLGKFGWELEEIRDHRSCRTVLLFKHEAMRLAAHVDDIDVNYYRTAEHPQRGYPPLQINAVYPMDTVRLYLPFDITKAQREECDLSPQYVDERTYIEGQSFFAKTKKETVLIEREANLSVLEHLERIKEQQAPEQKRIRERIQREAQNNNNLVESKIEVLSIAC
jgi:hypothetical protein